MKNYYKCFLTLHVSVFTSQPFIPSYSWYLVFGGATFEFNCASAPRGRNLDLQNFSFRESFLIDVLVGRHSRFFDKSISNFLEHYPRPDYVAKMHYSAVAIFKECFSI